MPCVNRTRLPVSGETAWRSLCRPTSAASSISSNTIADPASATRSTEVSRGDLPGLGSTWIERHQRRKTVGIDGRVVDSTIAREPRSGYREPVMREPAGDGRLGLFALTHLAFEVRPQSAERSAEHASKGWRSEVGQPSASLVGEAPQRVRPVPIGEEAVEQRAVRILRVAAGPVVEPTADAIDRLEAAADAARPTIWRKSPAFTRPCPVCALSSNVAMPSIAHSGSARLGKSTGFRPSARRRPPIHPRDRPR